MLGEVIKTISEVAKETSKEMAKETKNALKKLDKPLNTSEIIENASFEKASFKSKLKDLDRPLNYENSAQHKALTETRIKGNDLKEIRKFEKMEPQIVIMFICPDGMDKKEFTRQLKGQERGLNSQTLAENMANRAAFEQRKAETGNGRDLSEGKKAQDIAREKATQSRIESNQKNGMSYSEAKAEAKEWIKTQAALHNPDQIAGGDPTRVSRMGDSNVNSSIGSQWRTRVEQLEKGVKDYAKDKTREELENTKMNVKLVAV